MTEHPLTRYYNRLPEGSIENSTDPMPTTHEAIQARKIAIREGRLIVVDPQEPQDPGRVPVVRCIGCEFQTPQLTVVATGAAHQMATSASTPGRYLIVPGSALPPTGRYTDASGLTVYCDITYIDVTPVSGACKPDGSGCAEALQCGFVVEIGIQCDIYGTTEASPPTAPNVSFKSPVTGSYGAALVPVDVKDVKSVLFDDAIIRQCQYEMLFSVSVGCEDDLAITLDWAALDPLPSVGSWTEVSTDRATVLTLTCGKCTRVY